MRESQKCNIFFLTIRLKEVAYCKLMDSIFISIDTTNKKSNTLNFPLTFPNYR